MDLIHQYILSFLNSVHFINNFVPGTNKSKKSQVHQMKSKKFSISFKLRALADLVIDFPLVYFFPRLITYDDAIRMTHKQLYLELCWFHSKPSSSPLPALDGVMQKGWNFNQRVSSEFLQTNMFWSSKHQGLLWNFKDSRIFTDRRFFFHKIGGNISEAR